MDFAAIFSFVRDLAPEQIAKRLRLIYAGTLAYLIGVSYFVYKNETSGVGSKRFPIPGIDKAGKGPVAGSGPRAPSAPVRTAPDATRIWNGIDPDPCHEKFSTNRYNKRYEEMARLAQNFGVTVTDGKRESATYGSATSLHLVENGALAFDFGGQVPHLVRLYNWALQHSELFQEVLICVQGGPCTDHYATGNVVHIAFDCNVVAIPSYGGQRGNV